jgi:hypothetical protein
MRLRREHPLAPDAVDGAIPGCRGQPGTRVGRNALARPPLRGDRKRLLRGILGEVEVAEEPDERSEDAAPLVPKDAVEDG